MPSAEELVDWLRKRQEHWTGLRTRMGQIAALIAQDWPAVFGQEFDGEPPMVANIFKDTTDDVGRLFTEATPSQRVFRAGRRDARAAELREQIITSYSLRSNEVEQDRYHGRDYVAAGYTATKIWPNMRAPISQRFPMFERLNPFLVWPETIWRPHAPTDNVIVSYTDTVARLKEQFPREIGDLMYRVTSGGDIEARFRRLDYNLEKIKEVAEPKELEIISFYGREHIARAAVYENIHGERWAQLLLERENDTGICPIQISYRPTWGDEPRGQLDDAKGQVLGKNRMFNILLDYWIRMVYGSRLVWNVKNPSDKGIHYALGPDAFERPVAPEQPAFQAFQVLALLDEEGRRNAISLAAREGDVDLNKATAAFLGRAQGKLQSVVRELHGVHGDLKRRRNEAAMAQDEMWCNAKKEINGRARGRRFTVSYTPKDAIEGDYAHVVAYGTSSGLDAPTHHVMQLNKFQSGALSLETLLENDPDVEDVPEEVSRIQGMQMGNSILAGLQLPDTPLAERAQVMYDFFEGKHLRDVVKGIIARQQAALAAPQPAAGPPAGPGLAAPGLPGAEAPERPALPPPAALRTR